MKKIFVSLFSIALLFGSLTVLAENETKIVSVFQNIEKDCFEINIAPKSDGNSVVVIISTEEIEKLEDMADNIIAIDQKSITDNNVYIELYYDENYIHTDKLYIYASTNGLDLAKSELLFKTAENTIFDGFVNASSWNAYEALISKYNAAFDMFDLTSSNKEKLESLSATQRSDIYKNMYTKRNTFTNVDDIEKAYKDAIESVYSSRKESSLSSGGGGGGGNQTPERTLPAIGVPVTASVPTSAPRAESFTGFSDMETARWAVDAVNALKKRGIIDGISATEYDPDGIIKREDFVKILIGALGVAADGKAVFCDVVEGSYYEKYVNTAYALGIVNGISDSEFGVGSPIKRQDMAAMIYRAVYDADNTAESVDLVDFDNVSDYAKPAVIRLYSDGIINGMDDGRFMPDEYATRAQVAQMIYKLLIGEREE